MKKYRNPTIYFLTILSGIFLSLAYINPYDGKITLSELALHLSGSRGEFALGLSAVELVRFAMCMTPAWILEIFLGISLYQHFCTASIYVFSRCTNREKWYWKEMFTIGCHVLFFHIFVLCITILTTLLRYPITFDSSGMLLLLYHLILHSLWNYSMIILINLLALKYGSNMAFLTIVISQTIGITLLGIVEVLENFFEITAQTKELLLKLNPLSHMVLGWQQSFIIEINNIRSFICEGFYLENSLALLVIICIGVLLVGTKIVKKYDLLISDSEIGVL